MSAGQTVRFTTEWNFADEGTIPDWSVVAWAPNGGLSITHEGGWTSDSLPVIGGASNDDTTPADDDTTPADDDTTPADDDTTPADDDTTPADDDTTPADDDTEPVDVDWKKIDDDLRIYVNEYAVGDCSITLSNGWYGEANDGAWRPRVLVANTCTWLTFEITFFMSVEDWGNVENYYTDYDNEGNVT